MNNDINECNNNNSSEKNKNGKETPFYLINILKPIENENFHDMPLSPTHKSIKNRLFLSPPIKARRKSKNEIETKNLLRKSFMPKKNTMFESSKKDKELFNKTKTINNPNSYKNQNIYLRECRSISPVRKKRMKDNCNNNNNNDDTSNIFKFTNQLYENDEHFNKLLISKKNDMNPKNSPKKKIIVKFELDDNVSINKLYKKKISNIFRKKESYDINKGEEKRSFTNFIKMRTGYSPKKEREDEDINRTIRNSNYNQNMFTNYLEFNNKNNKDGDCTTKSVKFYSKSKTVKSKNMNVPDKSLVNEYDKTSKKKTNKKRGSLNSSIKNQTNFYEIPKKKKTKKKNTSKNKKKLFCLFCCLNSKQNDSDEVK